MDLPAPSISVVIPSRGRLQRLPSLVRSYLAQGADQVVVMLDGPHPGWEKTLVDLHGVPDLLIEELPQNLGLARARVEGVRRATGEIILLSDDDVLPGNALVERHRLFHAAHPDSALVGYMPVDLPRYRLRDQAATFLYESDYQNQVRMWTHASSKEIFETFWSGNASVPRQLYLRAEEYLPSVRLNYNEDLDLGLRLRDLGATAAFDIQARALHQHQRDYASFIRECQIRGGAVSDLELRWSTQERTALPQQLSDLVTIPDGHPWIVSQIQRAIGARATPGVAELLLGFGYQATGLLRIWRAQDALTRFIRRALAMRGYRLAREVRSAGGPISEKTRKKNPVDEASEGPVR